MALANYADLVDAVGNWLNRSDLAARIPEFIRLTEARLGRLLTDPDMQVTEPLVLTGASTPLPANVKEIIAIGGLVNRVRQATQNELANITSYSGDPRIYAISGSNLIMAPANTGTATITYIKDIPALTSGNATNWLMTRAPDVYLWGCLLQAEFFGWNDERLPLVKSGWDEAIQELRTDGERRRWGTAPIAPRVGRS